MCCRDEGSGGHRDRSWRCQHLVDQRGLEGSFNAAAHQVTQRDLEDVFTSSFAWEVENQEEEKNKKVRKGRKKSRKGEITERSKDGDERRDEDKQNKVMCDGE